MRPLGWTLGQVTQLLDPGTAEVLEQYQYDADGLRIAKLNGAGEVQEKYFYNGGKLSYVTDGSDKLLYYFTRSTSGALLSMVDCTGSAEGDPDGDIPLPTGIASQ